MTSTSRTGMMILSLSFEKRRKSAAPKRSKSSADIFENIPAGGHELSCGGQPNGGSGGSASAGGLRHESRLSSRGGASHPQGSCRIVSAQSPSSSFAHPSFCAHGFCISKRLPP